MKKLMIIDDNVQFINLVKEYFSDDFLIYTYYDFKKISDIIERVCKIIPDVILLDINLGVADGVAVIKEFLTHECLKKIPVLILTASDYNSVVESIVKKEPNVKGFYSKLTPLDCIKEKIDSVIGKEQL
ncbi:MAG: response regulator [Elusimicrobiales bacterium]|nr:response regulator [Elusimicrobiales bacterium]HPO95922.1 response regulator [Elusimicrobiales bacterium]